MLQPSTSCPSRPHIEQHVVAIIGNVDKAGDEVTGPGWLEEGCGVVEDWVNGERRGCSCCCMCKGSLCTSIRSAVEGRPPAASLPPLALLRMMGEA